MLLSPVQAAVSDQKEERAYNGPGDPMFAAWTESAGSSNSQAGGGPLPCAEPPAVTNGGVVSTAYRIARYVVPQIR